MRSIISILTLLLIFTLSANAQRELPKFGEIDPAEFLMKSYELDSSASAVILFDDGYSQLDYNSGPDTWIVKTRRHVRVKIFDKSQFDWADFEIPLHVQNSDDERIVNFRASCQTLRNGEMEIAKILRKDLIFEERAEFLTVAKFAIPQINEGSIVEIKYTIESPFIGNLWDWRFQYSIPVKYSLFEVNYPEWFIYSSSFRGYDLQYVSLLDIEHDMSRLNFGNGGSKYKRMRFGWEAKEMPAFDSEEFITAESNYRVGVDFNLSATHFPNSIRKNYSTTWQVLLDELMDRSSFGVRFTRAKSQYAYRVIEELGLMSLEREERLQFLYNHIKAKINWNDQYGIYTRDPLKKIYENGSGNIAELNLNLFVFLRSAGFDVEPVLLSTRAHGYLIKSYPALSQFNYLVVQLTNPDGSKILMDASESGLPKELLPPRCINETGMVCGDLVSWVDVLPTGTFDVTNVLNLEMNEDLSWYGTMGIRAREYASAYYKSLRAESTNSEEFYSKLTNSIENITIIKENESEPSTIASFKTTFDIRVENSSIDAGDLIYIDPMMTMGIDENPFKKDGRSFPIDFNYPYSRVHSISLKIPDGYKLEELPESTSMRIENDGGLFNYSVKRVGESINIISQFKISRHLYLPQEYLALKQFYTLVMEKQAEQIVLKKS